MIQTMDEKIAEQLAIRDRFLRRLSLQRTPAERMELMLRLQAQARHVLAGSPQGYAHFLRRNYKARRITPVDEHATR
jgi:hypothetical protein